MPRPILNSRAVRGFGRGRKQGAGPSPGFLIRPAEMRDMTVILGLIDEAAVWLNREKGTDQWQRPWPDRAARDQRIRRGIKNGRTWMVEDHHDAAAGGGKPVATVSCGRGGNKKLWTARERAEYAVYISRLIVSRNYAGLGIGAALLNWAGLRGREDWRAEWIRLDVWTSNLELQAFYIKQGFANIRTYKFDNAWEYPSAALFQKPTQDIVSADAGRFREVR